MKLFEYVTAQHSRRRGEAARRLGAFCARPRRGQRICWCRCEPAGSISTGSLTLRTFPELTDVSFDPATGLTLGAAVPCYRTYTDAQVTSNYPALVDSTTIIGGIQIQGRASVGGNLCNSSPSGDTLPTLIALGASCLIAGPSGRRTVPAEEFCIGPGSNVLEDGEMLVSLNFSTPAENTGAHFPAVHTP